MDPRSLRHAWADLPADHPMPRITRRRLRGERILISEVVLEPGFEVEPHRHENEQFALVLEGRVRFAIGEDRGSLAEIEVAAGEVLHLPANILHGARALERSRLLDLFSPPADRTGVDAAS